MTPAFHPEAVLAYEEGLEVRGSQLIQKATISRDSAGEIREGFLVKEALELSRN